MNKTVRTICISQMVYAFGMLMVSYAMDGFSNIDRSMVFKDILGLVPLTVLICGMTIFVYTGCTAMIKDTQSKNKKKNEKSSSKEKGEKREIGFKTT